MHWENLFGCGRITPLMVKTSDNISGIVELVPGSKYYIFNGISYLAGVVRTVLLPAGSTVGKAWEQIMVKPSLEHYSFILICGKSSDIKVYCKHCHFIAGNREN